MRIGELAKRTGMSRDTIRFYERQGLIDSLPSRDPANSYRDYPEMLVERLAMITEAREAGLSVADLTLLITAMETGGDGTFDVNAFIDAKIAQVEETLAKAQRFLNTLVATRAALSALPEEWHENQSRSDDSDYPARSEW